MSDKNNLVHTRTCVYNIRILYYFTTKYRKKVFKDKIESRFKEILFQIADKNEFIIETMEIMPDYVYLFISAHPEIFLI